MDDTYETERPAAAELEAQKTAILAFRASRHGMTKVSLAIAFVRERGSATSAELHVLMGLEPTDSVSTYLASATKTDRLVKDGKTWTLGKNSTPKSDDALQSGAELGLRTDLKAPVFGAIHPQLNQLPQQQECKPDPKPSPKAPACRFAVWSDGRIEIAKPGSTGMELTLDEVDELMAFLVKIGRAA